MTVDLWNFSLSLYARPGVEAACLQLQSAGADVCLLLTGVWLDRHGVAHTAEREAQLRQLAEPWQRQVVVPLRALRQNWRDAAQQDATLASLRQQLKQLELDAEQAQLRKLETLAQGWPTSAQHRQRHWLDALAPAHCSAARDGLYSASLG